MAEQKKNLRVLTPSYKIYPEEERDYKNFMYPDPLYQYPIDPAKEPLLANLERLNVLKKSDKEYLQLFDPNKKDYIVIRNGKDYSDISFQHLPGQQLRDAYAISAAYLILTKSTKDPKAPKLDDQAKHELVKAIKAYPIHKYDAEGKPIPGESRVGKTGAESIQQVSLDTKNSDRQQFMSLRIYDKYNGRLPKTPLGSKILREEAEAEAAKKAEEKSIKKGAAAGEKDKPQTRSQNDDGKTSMSMPEGIKNLEDVRLIATQLNKAMNSVASTDSDLDAKAMSLIDEDGLVSKKHAI